MKSHPSSLWFSTGLIGSPTSANSVLIGGLLSSDWLMDLAVTFNFQKDNIPLR
jgi:hypothetical protein